MNESERIALAVLESYAGPFYVASTDTQRARVVDLAAKQVAGIIAQGPPAPIPSEPEPCAHEWRLVDDSFAHEFGTEVVKYWECDKCGATKPTNSDDAGSPEP